MSEKPITLIGALPGHDQRAVEKMTWQAFMIAIIDAGGRIDIPIARIDTATVGKRLNIALEEDLVFSFTVVENLEVV